MTSARFLVSALALCLLSLAAPATAATVSGYGFRLGLASSTIRGGYDPLTGLGSRPGFCAGVFACIPMSRTISVQPELGWTSKGDAGYTDLVVIDPQQLGATYVETRIEYLECPVLLRLDAPTGGFIAPYFLGGPAFAFRTGSSREYTAEMWGYPIYEVYASDDPGVRSFDASLIAGAGLGFGRGHLRLALESRYVAGVVGIYPDVARKWGRNSGWTATVGVELR